MTLSQKLRLQQTKTLKSGQIYSFVLEHKNYRINEPDQFLENSRISFFAFLDAENNLHHFNRLAATQPAKTKLEEILQIPSIKKIQIYEVTGASEQEMNSIKVDELDASEQEQVQLLKKLSGTFTVEERSAAKGNEVELQKYLTENMSDYIDSQDLPV
jgi:DNA-directed RNA polymerase subunit F